MNLFSKILLPMALALAAATMSAEATQLSGIMWENFPNFTGGNKNATFANVAVMQALSSSTGATFSVNAPLNMTSNPPGSYTVGGFLSSGGATGITYFGGAASGDNLDNTLFYFTGNVSLTHNQSFSITHDDGVQLMITLPGNQSMFVINSPSPTTNETDNLTYTGPTGTFNFKLVYAEVDGAPGILNIPLTMNPGSVPIPDAAGTLGLLSMGAACVMGLRRKLGIF